MMQVADKQMKRSSVSWSIRKTQNHNETTLYTYQISKIKKQNKTVTPPNAGKDVAQQALSPMAGRSAKWYRHGGRQFGTFLLNMLSLSAVVLFAILSKDLANLRPTKTRVQYVQQLYS